MSFFKYIERIKKIHSLIEKECTGSSKDFALKVGISRSLLMEHLKEMRETFNAPIQFCRIRNTFYSKQAFHLNIQITVGLDKLKGGENCYSIFFAQSPDVLDSVKLDLHS